MEVEDLEYCSFGMECGGEHRWTARSESDSMKVDTEELEHCLLGPEESEVDIRHIVINANGKKRRSVRRVRVTSWESVQRDGTIFSTVRARQEEEEPRAQQGHQIHERQAREAFGYDGT